jgi:hypothetical protein
MRKVLELSIYMEQHSYGTCIYLLVDTIIQSLWFLSGCPWSRVATNTESTELMVPFGEIEVISSDGRKKKYKRTNNDLQSIHIKLKTNTNPTKTRVWTQVFRKGKQLLKEIISMFPLWTFHLYVAAFLRHLYISLSWYDNPELVVPIRMSLIEGCY